MRVGAYITKISYVEFIVNIKNKNRKIENKKRKALLCACLNNKK